MLEMYKQIWSGVIKQIKCNSTESIKYERDPMKIRLDSYDDDLHLGTILCFSVLYIYIESVFSNSRQVSSPNSHS